MGENISNVLKKYGRFRFMMKQLLISVCLIFTFSCTDALSNDDKTYVSLDVIEMNVERVNDNLFRWLKFHPDSE